MVSERSLDEYLCMYNLYALDFQRPKRFNEGMPRPACLWKEAPPMRKLCPLHWWSSTGPFALRKAEIRDRCIGTPCDTPGNSGSSGWPGMRNNSSCRTLIGHNLFGCADNSKNCTTPVLAVLASRREIQARRPPS